MPPTLWSNSSMPESSTRPSRLPATSWYGSPMCTTATIASEWSIRPEARTDRPPTATARSSPSFSSTPTTTTTRSKTHSSTWSPSSTRRPSPDHAASKATIREGAATTTITRRDHGTPIPPSDSMATLTRRAAESVNTGPFEAGQFGSPQTKTSAYVQTGEVFCETERLELASDLLEVASEAQLDRVLTDLISRVGQDR